MALHLICECFLLRLIAMLKQFLNDVVPEHVCHELDRVRLYFGEDLLFLIAIGGFELLLNES